MRDRVPNGLSLFVFVTRAAENIKSVTPFHANLTCGRAMEEMRGSLTSKVSIYLEL
ncbi:MAG: hypothetical protein JRF53_13250 [Deltaproteobacteria bacterium]|nr:hypothetical protein [Deltaproteobacteria bacterium]